jgi:uncharacterized membrane protein
MRKSLVVIVALFALASIQFTYYYPRLPGTLASHFDASGIPNSWEPKGVFFGFYALVLIIVTVPSLVISRLLLSLPSEYINLPNKQYWLAPERRAATAEYFFDHLAKFCAATLALLIAIFQLAIVANLPGASGTLSWAVWALLGAFLIFAIFWGGTLFFRFRRV